MNNEETNSTPNKIEVGIGESNANVKPREYNKNHFLIPNEIEIKKTPFGTITAFQTSDKEVYYREINGVIHSQSKKVKGKANVKKAKKDKMGRKNGLK